MLGPGSYFADYHQKALNYTDSDSDGNHYLLLCEVDLGKINEFNDHQ